MRLPGDHGQLTYCLNIHPAQTWQQVQAALAGPVRTVKDTVSPDQPFAVGLRLSGEAVEALEAQSERDQLKQIFVDNDFRAVTMNGFPYGPFHGTTVKEDVYQPDWRSGVRVAYTTALADIMAGLATDNEMISLSTVPGTFKPLGAGAEQLMADNYVTAIAHCVRLRMTTGRWIAIAIEPEPFCFLETIEETVSFFSQYLFSDRAARTLADLTGLTPSEAADALPEHIGLCYDVCHAAVEYEDPADSIAALRSAGIPVHKLQLSAALRVATVNNKARSAVAAFNEPVYLHQVVSRSPAGLRREKDLPEALERGASADGEEWRIHFHVPIFVDDIEHLGTTQGFLGEILDLHRREPISPHLEVETYTWDVLPADLRAMSMEAAISRELRWVMDRLQ